jgi:hypothetical protein
VRTFSENVFWTKTNLIAEGFLVLSGTEEDVLSSTPEEASNLAT